MQKLTMMDSLLKKEKRLSKTVDTLRSRINKTSRPLIRPLRILDLPHEILVNIFEVFEEVEKIYGGY